MNKLLLIPWRVILHLRGYYRTALDNYRKSEDARYRDNVIGRNVHLGQVVLEGHNVIAPDVQIYGEVHIGRYSTIGHRGTLHGGHITIGRYCQLGPNVAVYAATHSTNSITTYNNPALFEGRLKHSETNSRPVFIGHDVWIGHGAIILPGVNIGTGAVIGAGAIVTKDVEAYSVVVGSPAKVIKKRLSDNIIQTLDAWKWWDLTPEELAPHEGLFHLNLNTEQEQFITTLHEHKILISDVFKD